MSRIGKKRILLVNPWIYDFAAYDLWAQPLGLLYAGGMLREAGCETSYIDCLNSDHPGMNIKAPRVRPGGHHKFYRTVLEKPEVFAEFPRRYARYGISPEVFEDELAKIPEPNAILVTCIMTYWYPGAFKAIRKLKDRFPEVPLVLGGIYATLCSEHAGAFSKADIVLPGPACRHLPGCMEKLLGINLPRGCDIDKMPPPCLDLIPNPTYAPVLASTGCPFECSYCAAPIISGKFHARDTGSVISETARWRDELEVRDFAFYDDALLAGGTRLLKRLPELGVRFHCPNALHARWIDSTVAGLLKEGGFQTIRIGLETSDPERIRASGGKVEREEFRAAVENLLTAGYRTDEVGAYVLCGLPKQEAREVWQTIDFARNCGSKPVLAEYSPIPGTAMWKDAVSASRYPLESEPLTHNSTLLPCQWDGLTGKDYRELKDACR